MWWRAQGIVVLSLMTGIATAAESRFSELENYISQFTKADERIALNIIGVSGDLKTNVEAYIGELSQEDLSQWRETLPRLRKASREALESMGYYQAEVKFTRQQKSIDIHITPNQAVIIESVKLSYVGEASNDIAFTALQETFPIKECCIMVVMKVPSRYCKIWP